MRSLLKSFLLIVILFHCGFSLEPLLVHSSGRYLQTVSGQPFFYLGDTGWELFHRLNRSEADTYLSDRASRGYTVIQAVLLAELNGLTVANAHGDLPLISNDPTQPNVTPGNNPANATEYDYWDHADYIIDRAAQLGLYVGLLPTWGDKVLLKWGPGPEIFNTTAKAYAYGRFLGDRYKNRTNIIWILGGDRPAVDGSVDRREIWRAMAEGIADGVNGVNKQDGQADWSTTLMTYHPIGGATSSTWFHSESWLDFNMFQSGHSSRDNSMTWTTAFSDWGKTPAKPTLDGEPCYEDHPVANNPANGWFNDYDVRKAVWRSVFSGGAGVTYGAHGIWQMYAPGRTAVNSVRTYWYNSLTLPGGSQMQHLKKLMLSRPFFNRVSDASLVEVIGSGGDRMAATRASDGSWAAIYFPRETLSRRILASRLSGTTLRAWWYNPRDGKTYNAAGTQSNQPFSVFTKADTTFDPPGSNASLDWVLVLDDAAKGFGVPGL